MTRNLVISGILAAAFHATVLFGFNHVTPPKPLPVATESLEVELTAAPEETAPPAEVPPTHEPEPVIPTPPPEPEPIPEPPPAEPQVTTPESLSEPVPEPVKKPEPVEPPVAPVKPKPPAPKQKPKSLTSAPKLAATTSGGQPNGSAPAGVKKSGPTTAIRVRSNPAPAYPAACRSAHQEGIVSLDVQVNANGLPTAVSIIGSSGFAALDQAALAAVRRWRFQPAQVADTPVAGRVRVPVRFRLER